jgi:chromosomal replication initiator protein
MNRSDYNTIANRNINTETIETVVCKEMGIIRKMLRGNSRVAPIPQARFIFFKIARDMKMFKNLKELGAYFNRDHSTVIHACKKVDDFRLYDKEYSECYNNIEAELERIQINNIKTFIDGTKGAGKVPQEN